MKTIKQKCSVAVFPPKIPRVKTSSARYATLQRLKAASKSMRLVSDAMRHIGYTDKAAEANGAHMMLNDWINGMRAEMMQAVGIDTPSTGEAACLPNAEDHGPPRDPSNTTTNNVMGGPVHHLVGRQPLPEQTHGNI